MFENAGEGVRPVGERLGVLFATLIGAMVLAPLVAGGIAGAVLGPKGARTAAAAAIFVQLVAMLACSVWRLRAHGVRFSDLRPFAANASEVASGIAWGVGMLFINAFAAQLSLLLFRSMLGPEWVAARLAREQAVMARLLDTGAGPFYLEWTVFVAVGVAPLVEEVFFRGYAYSALKHHAGRSALWLSGVLFASVHLYVINFIPLFVLGTLMAWLYEKTGSIAVPAVAHAVMNCFVAIIVIWASGIAS